jgi:hypothetical protein
MSKKTKRRKASARAKRALMSLTGEGETGMPDLVTYTLSCKNLIGNVRTLDGYTTLTQALEQGDEELRNGEIAEAWVAEVRKDTARIVWWQRKLHVTVTSHSGEMLATGPVLTDVLHCTTPDLQAGKAIATVAVSMMSGMGWPTVEGG